MIFFPYHLLIYFSVLFLFEFSLFQDVFLSSKINLAKLKISNYSLYLNFYAKNWLNECSNLELLTIKFRTLIQPIFGNELGVFWGAKLIFEVKKWFWNKENSKRNRMEKFIFLAPNAEWKPRIPYPTPDSIFSHNSTFESFVRNYVQQTISISDAEI